MHLNSTTAWRRAIPTRSLKEPWVPRLATAGVFLAFFLLALLAFALLLPDNGVSALRLMAVVGLSAGLGAAVRSSEGAAALKNAALVAISGDVKALQSRISELEWWHSRLDLYARDLARTHQELDQARSTIDETSMATLETLASAVDARDPNTYGHCRRVAELASMLAQEMGMDDANRETLVRAALLHDIGKLGVPDSTLRKTTPLNREDSAALRQHPDIGYRMLSGLHFLGEGLAAIRYHHERFDGSGYPHGLAGEQIPQMARILAVADAYDAITSDRPYRLGRPKTQAVEEVLRCSGTHFDPAVVAALLRVLGRPSWAAPEANSSRAEPPAEGPRDLVTYPGSETVAPLVGPSRRPNLGRLGRTAVASRSRSAGRRMDLPIHHRRLRPTP